MRMRSKRGITLVELAICCAITLLLGTACLTVLLSGRGMFDKGVQTANSMLEADIFQTFMMQQLPYATGIAQTVPNDLAQSERYSHLTAENGKLTIDTGGSTICLATIKDCSYAVIPAGLPSSKLTQPQLVYTLHFEDGASLSGGFVMANMRYEDALMESFSGALSEKPLVICSALPAAQRQS